MQYDIFILILFICTFFLWFPIRYFIKLDSSKYDLKPPFHRPFIIKQNELILVVKTDGDFEEYYNLFLNVHNQDLLYFSCIGVVSSLNYGFEEDFKLPVFSKIKKSNQWRLKIYLSGNNFCCNNACEQGRECPLNKQILFNQ